MLFVFRRLTFRPALACFVALACQVGAARGEEPIVEFLHAVQDHGYGEIAIEYLTELSARGRLPKPLAETMDLELSRSYRVAVGEAFNAVEAEARLAKSQQYLDKFLKEHPDHPEVARAFESWGDLALDRALQRIRQAAATKDATQKAKLFAAARADLQEAQPRYADATTRYFERYTKAKAAAATDSRRPKSAALLTKKQRQADDAAREAETAWLDCRFKEAKIDFYLASTYPDRQAPERIAALQAAATKFDAVFQSYRESLVGLHAHLWHGRAADEMGNDQLALDIYDEVLATAPEGRERETGLEPLFAQVQYHRLLVTLRKNGTDEFLTQAGEWLQLHRTWKKYDGYQGVALEMAKANLKKAEEETGAKKTSLTQGAIAMLSEVAKQRGEHQAEAILLRREHVKSDVQDLSTVKNFDEGFALGESAAENLDWPAAIAAFTRALELSSTSKDAKRLAEAHVRLDQARYQLAAADFAAGKLEACLAGVQTIVDERPDSALAPAASALAVSAALSLYAKAQDQPATLAQLTKIATQTIERWPDKAEADDARIALGQASLVRGDLEPAIAVFEHVNPRSLRYPAAMYLAGQTHWRQYNAAKSKPEAAQHAEQLASQRATAEEQLRISLAGQRKDDAPGKPLTRQVFETQLLLGEVKLEAGQAPEAAELLAPLVDWVRAEKPDPLDNTMLRVFLTAARAQAASGDLPKAAATANSLVELGADNPTIDGVLNTLVKLFGDQWKQAEAGVIEARTASDPNRLATAEAAAAQRKDLLSQLLARVASRQHNSLTAMIYIADTCAQLGQTDTARELYQAILAQAETDAAFKQANASALTRIQAQLVGLLRQKGQFAEGLKQVDKLIEAFPNALEPKMEKGRLLQGWADTEPAHWSEAVAHWTMLRTRLARLTKKPPEYYEVVYNAAFCLFTESLKTQNQQKALQADQLLSATLVLSPHLSGPDMVAKYKELLQRARQLRP